MIEIQKEITNMTKMNINEHSTDEQISELFFEDGYTGRDIPVSHDECEAFYCKDCKLTYSLNELVERDVEIKNDGGKELSAYCPDCPSDEACKMSNAGHLEAHTDGDFEDFTHKVRKNAETGSLVWTAKHIVGTRSGYEFEVTK